MPNLDIYNTHMELYPYKQFDQVWLEKLFTATDSFSNSEFACGYIIHEGRMYLPKGTPVSKLKVTSDCIINEMMESDPIEYMSRRHSSYYEPRNKIQVESIEFLKGEGHQLGLNLSAGFGKTFCVSYASTELNLRTLVITPNSGLKSQWIKTYSTMFDYKKKELMDIGGSNIMEMIMNKELPEADVYFVNHQTIRSFLTQFGPYKLKEFFNVLGAGIKVYDESHMEFANILLIDFLSNTDRTWYLTATFDRSDKTESRCFRQAFSTVDTFGKFESSQMNRKHVIYHNVYINSHISPKNRAKVMGYPSFNAMKYGQYCIMNDENDTAYKTILAILNKTTNMEGKTLIFLPLIENVDEVVKRLKRDYPQKSVAAYHSKIPKDEKLSAENKDIIVTTIKSCGTGKDIKGLRSVICLEPVASKVLTEQLIGRLRPYADDKDTYFWDCIDISIPGVNWFHRARFKIIPSLVKQVIDINDIFG